METEENTPDIKTGQKFIQQKYHVQELITPVFKTHFAVRNLAWSPFWVFNHLLEERVFSSTAFTSAHREDRLKKIVVQNRPSVHI